MPRSKKAADLPSRPCAICLERFAPMNRRNTCCSAACSVERKRRRNREWYADPVNASVHIRNIIARRRAAKR